MAKKGKGSGGSIDFKVTASGLNKVDKDAKKAGNSFNTLDKNARSTDRAGKGVAQMSSNVTKNFSKMSQGITGGLVPAYATLAAQLFALDAVFRFLREAADFRVLQEGQEAFAGVTGRAMKTLARDVQEATAAQITFKEASQATAIALAAGLSPSQLNELGEAAKTVSIALGRDTTDSFNRLVRGVTKAEPELLDELGIILRLDEATTKYAASLGLNKNQLTTFQKSQAVVNDVLEQAETRYGAIQSLLGEDSVNALNQLMVAFDEVLNRFRTILGPVAEFFGKFLVENINSATAAIGVFAASITGGLIRGALPNLDYTKSGQQAASIAGSGDLKVTKMMSKERIGRLATPGAATKADIAAYEKATKAKTSSMLKFEHHTRREHKRTVAILKAQRQRMVADSAIGFERMKREFLADLYEMQAEHGRVMGAMKFAGMQFGKFMNGVMRLAGFIGIAVMIFEMGKQLFQMFTKADKRVEELNEKTKELTETQKQLNSELEKTVTVFEAELLGVPETIQQIGQAFQSADLSARIYDFRTMLSLLGRGNPEVQAFRDEIIKTIEQLGVMDPAMASLAKNIKRGNVTMYEAHGILRQTTALRTEQAAAVGELSRAEANSVKQTNKLVQALPKIPFQDVIRALETEARLLTTLTEIQGMNNVETERYALQQEKVNAELRQFNFLAEAAFKRQVALNKANMHAERFKLGVFGSKRETSQALAETKQMAKVLEAQEKLATARIQERLVEAQQGNVEQAKRQKKLAEDTLELEIERLGTLRAQNNEFFVMHSKLMQDLSTDLGKSFGKILRGEANAFKDFGKTMAKNLTDSLGKMLAERQLELMFGGTPLDPNFQREKFTQQVRMEFKKGFSDPDSDFMKGSKSASEKIKEGMELAADYHLRGLRNFALDSAKANAAAAGIAESDIKAQFDKVTKDSTAHDDYLKGKSTYVRDSSELLRQRDAVNVPFNRSSTISRGSNMPFMNMEMDAAMQGDVKRFVFPDGTVFMTDKYTGISDAEATALQNYQNQLGAMDPEYQAAMDRGDVEKVSTVQQRIESEIKLYEERTKEYQELNKKLNALHANFNLTTEQEIALREKQEKALDVLPKVTKAYEDAKIATTAATTVVTELENETATTKGEVSDLGNAATDTKNKIEDLGLTVSQLVARDYPGLSSQPSTKAMAEFGLHTAKFGGFIAQGLALTGDQEKAAKLMQKVAILQYSLLLAEKAMQMGQAFQTSTGGNIFAKLGDAFMAFVTGGARYGGVMSGSGRSFAGGGVASGPESGYGAVLHGTEAVVPLGNDRSIPVKMQNGGGTNNVNVTVNVDQNGQSESILTGDGARELGQTIAAIAQDTIAKEQRAGGLLSNI
jgi:hypothetical protein